MHSSPEVSSRLIMAASQLADSRPIDHESAEHLFPLQEIGHLREEGFLRAPLGLAEGGLGLGTINRTTDSLLCVLKELGRANLSLGRIYEGHVNALHLIHSFGNEKRIEEAGISARDGKLMGVWNTEGANGLFLLPDGTNGWLLRGCKTFASGAGHVDYPVVNARMLGGGWQMCVIPMNDVSVGIDKASWHPMGMKASGSFTVDFSGVALPQDALIGKPDDYYRQPLFSGGAIRTAAVQLGGAEALVHGTRSYLQKLNRANDPFQRMRAAKCQVAIQSGRQWLRYAAEAADEALRADASPSQAEAMVFSANMTRLAIEQACSQVLQLTVESVGARGLMPPFRFAAIVSDLTMYLRQPSPDACMTEVGRYALEGERPVP